MRSIVFFWLFLHRGRLKNLNFRCEKIQIFFLDRLFQIKYLPIKLLRYTSFILVGFLFDIV